MIRPTFLVPLAGIALLLTLGPPLRGDYPQPSPYPVSWELTFEHAKPRRIIVQAPGDEAPHAYWYVTYHVTNSTDRDKILFYPSFDLLTGDGNLIRSDDNIKPAVFDAVKDREHIKYLQNANEISGPLRQGEDQSRDGVAIWPEPNPRMGTFSIFVAGFWGESATVKVGDQDVILHKVLQLTYHLNGDPQRADDAELIEQDSHYVMR
ncbi:MAG: hypothetical protein ABR964_05060 [Tepidisphaeraceae bacterium]|jgi:hypothetical protein